MSSCNHALGEKMAGRFGWAVREWFKYKNKLGDRMIKQLSTNETEEEDASNDNVICQCLADQLFASAFGFAK